MTAPNYELCSPNPLHTVELKVNERRQAYKQMGLAVRKIAPYCNNDHVCYGICRLWLLNARSLDLVQLSKLQ